MAPALDHLPDAELLARYVRGDAAAFGALLGRHQRPLYNFLLRSARNVADAEDLLQETWSRVIRSSDAFNQKSKFTTWLYTIARNLCVDHARKRQHRRHASLDASPGDDGAALVEGLANPAPGTEQAAESGRLTGRIVAAVEALPEEQREVFLLRQAQQMPFAEIALVVGAPENTVKSRMRYALERLQAALADCWDPAEARA